MIRRLSQLLLLVSVVALGGCAGSTPSASPSPVPPSPGGGGGAVTGVGPGISIDEAIASTSAEPLLVNGALVVAGNEVRLCSARAESFPPQCAGSSLVVQGLDLDTIAGMQSASGVSWTEGQVQVLGTVDDGILTVAQTQL